MLTEIKTDSTTYQFTYGDFDQRTEVTIDGYGTLASYVYTNDQNKYLKKLEYGNGDSVEYEYDDKGRVTKQIYEDDQYVLYTYDKNGNILSVTTTEKNSEGAVIATHTTSYEYDSANQLIRENNQAGDFTYTWTYDNAGNILARKEYSYTTENLKDVTPTDTVNYTYSETGWRDLLLSYDENTIEYDQIGNPETYGGWNLIWKHGRALVSMTKDGTTWSHTYNANGMRIKRSNGTTSYTYAYSGGELDYMYVTELSADGKYTGTTLRFTHAPDGTPLSVVKGTTTCYYVTNLQGDVIAIVDANGNKIVEYSYDAWGKPLTAKILCSESDENYSAYSAIAEYNPLRYRGYIYDEETGLYYVSSRYYDPEIGRFINADGVIAGVGGSIQGYNMFAYCFNNPVNMDDQTGNWPKILKEIGARIKHAVKIMTKIITSPLKAATVEVGGGVGYGASAKVVAAGLPIEVGASATITDSYVYDKGTHDLRNTSSAEAGVNLLSVVDVSSSVGKSHSYFDEQCNCSFWNSTFGEKTNCLANKDYITGSATLGFSAGLYIALGFEFSFSFDFKAWGDELISIYHESLLFEGYY